MRASGAVQVLRSAQALRQSRRACPPSGHVRLHSASCSVQVLWHAATALPRVAASDRPTVATRNSARRRDRNFTLLRPLYGRQRAGRADRSPRVAPEDGLVGRTATDAASTALATRVEIHNWLVLPPVRRLGGRHPAGPPTPHI